MQRGVAGQHRNRSRLTGSLPGPETQWLPRREAVAPATPRGLGNLRGVVLLVGDVVAPGRAVAFVVDVEHRDVGHESVRGGTVPVVLAGLEDAVTGSDHP